MKLQIEIQQNTFNKDTFFLIIGIPIMESIAFYKQSLSTELKKEGDFIKWDEFKGLLTKHIDLLIPQLNTAFKNKGYNLECKYNLDGIYFNKI